jgi:hypothetical protein
VDASVSPPGRPHLRTHFAQLSVSIADVTAWTLDTTGYHAAELKTPLEKEVVI